jgi:hypothetical protein
MAEPRRREEPCEAKNVWCGQDNLWCKKGDYMFKMLRIKHNPKKLSGNDRDTS